VAVISKEPESSSSDSEFNAKVITSLASSLTKIVNVPVESESDPSETV